MYIVSPKLSSEVQNDIFVSSVDPEFLSAFSSVFYDDKATELLKEESSEHKTLFYDIQTTQDIDQDNHYDLVINPYPEPSFNSFFQIDSSVREGKYDATYCPIDDKWEFDLINTIIPKNANSIEEIIFHQKYTSIQLGYSLSPPFQTSLTSISIGVNSVSSKVITLILNSLPSIKKIRLWGIRFDNCFESIFENSFPQLEELYIICIYIYNNNNNNTHNNKHNNNNTHNNIACIGLNVLNLFSTIENLNILRQLHQVVILGCLFDQNEFVRDNHHISLFKRFLMMLSTHQTKYNPNIPSTLTNVPIPKNIYENELVYKYGKEDIFIYTDMNASTSLSKKLNNIFYKFYGGNISNIYSYSGDYGYNSSLLYPSRNLSKYSSKDTISFKYNSVSDCNVLDECIISKLFKFKTYCIYDVRFIISPPPGLISIAAEYNVFPRLEYIRLEPYPTQESVMCRKTLKSVTFDVPNSMGNRVALELLTAIEKRGLPFLKGIDLLANRIEDEFIERFSNVLIKNHIYQLTTFSTIHNLYEGTNWNNFFRLFETGIFHNLETLCIDGIRIQPATPGAEPDIDPLLHSLTYNHMPKLKHFTFANISHSTNIVQRLFSSLKENKTIQLELINVSYNSNADVVLSSLYDYINANRCLQLDSLNLAFTRSQDVFPQICTCILSNHLPKLKTLNLNGHHINNNNYRQLFTALTCSYCKIEELNIMNHEMDRESYLSLLHLLVQDTPPTLKRLYMNSSSLIQDINVVKEKQQFIRKTHIQLR
ncbi:hypothetical protein WA158_001686 [Blastocystis sp. Blastoise]